MQTTTLDTLRDAIARNAGGVISLPSSGMLRHHKTRFLLAEDPGFWIEAPPREKPLIDQIIVSQQVVGVTLKAAASKVIFTSTICEFRAQMPINRHLVLDALLLSWPQELKCVQRRADYRVSIPTGAEVTARVWRMSEQQSLRDKLPSALMINGYLRNLSAGGVGLICKIPPGERKPVLDQRLRVMLVHPGGELLLEARIRYCQQLPNGEFRVGAQFRKMEGDLEGRQALATLSLILGRLQREEIRRHRLGLSVA